MSTDREARTPRLIIQAPGEAPRSHTLAARTLIGRGEHCDLRLDDATVSEDHAEVQRYGRSFLLNDLASSNGTVLNGLVIGQPTKLRHGDVVQVGPFRMQLSLPAASLTVKAPVLSIHLTDEERAVAATLVAPYRTGHSFAGRPATRAEIAEQLHISESSVKRRLDSLAMKLHVTEQGRDRPRLIADRVLALGLDLK